MRVESSDENVDGVPAEALKEHREAMMMAIADLDAPRILSVINECSAAYGVDVLVVHLLVPIARRVQNLWDEGSLSIHQRRYASRTICEGIAALNGRSRPVAIPRKAGERRVILACPPGESHLLALNLFAALLVDRGWTAQILGPKTSWAAIAVAIRAAGADAVVLAGNRPYAMLASRAGIERLALTTSVFLAGTSAKYASAHGTTLLDEDWRAAAIMVDAVRAPHAAPVAPQRRAALALVPSSDSPSKSAPSRPPRRETGVNPGSLGAPLGQVAAFDSDPPPSETALG